MYNRLVNILICPVPTKTGHCKGHYYFVHMDQFGEDIAYLYLPSDEEGCFSEEEGEDVKEECPEIPEKKED